MNVRTLLSAAAIISAVTFPGIAFGQEEHMISGKAVPADQVTEVQTKCDALRKEAPAGDAAAPAADAAAPAADAAAPAADAAAPAADAAATTAGWLDDGSRIDIEQLTVALCDEGKFVAAAM